MLCGLILSVIIIAFVYCVSMSDDIISEINDYFYEIFKKSISKGNINAWLKCKNCGFMVKFIDMEINKNDRRMSTLTEYADNLLKYNESDISFDYEKITYRIWKLKTEKKYKLMHKFNDLICDKIKNLYTFDYIIKNYKGKYKKHTYDYFEEEIINTEYKKLKRNRGVK